MYKLTPWTLFFIFFCFCTPSASARESALQELDGQTLLSRSYHPDLLHRILLRSTLVLRPAGPQTRGEGHVAVDSAPRPVAVAPTASPPPAPKATLPSLAAFGLSPRALEKLERYDHHIRRYSRMNGIDPNLTRALIYVESSGDPAAVSPKGAQGLMQLMPSVASEMGVSNPLDPAQNIFGGTRYLGGLLNRFERVDLALWAYNAGPTSVRRKRLPRETKHFVPEVLRVKSILDLRGI
jgi:hypothetical protein